MAQTWRTDATQDRSRDTERRIVDATIAMLADQSYEDLRIADVARRAKVSVGGLYARFADKNALIHAVDERLVAAMGAEVRRALDPERVAPTDLEGLVTAYVQMMVRWFARHRAIAREVVLRARSSADPAFAKRVRDFNRFAHGTLCERLVATGRIRHPDPGAAAAFGVMLVSAGAREAVLFGNEALNLSSPTLRQLERELVRAFLCYLGTR